MRKLALLFALASAPAAWAQYTEVWFSGGETFYKNSGLGSFSTLGGSPNDLKLDDGFRFGFRMNINTDTLLGYEFLYAYSRAQLVSTVPASTTGPSISTKQGMAAHTYGGAVLLHANHEGNRFRPFAAGGVEAINFVPPGSSATSGGGDTKFGFNYGAGLKIRLTDLIGLRLDARQYTVPKPFQGSRYGIPTPANGWIRLNELSVGVGIMF